VRVLITNNTLDERAGSEMYVRDVVLALLDRGHEPIAFSTKLGAVARELRAATVPVLDDLAELAVAPDVIHGQHHLDAMIAMLHFPQTPAVYFCHGWLPWEEMPPKFPTLRHYVAVDDLCAERLHSECGIAPDHVRIIRNFVDLRRVPKRARLPEKPRRALVFSNSAREDGYLGVIRTACAQREIAVDAIGAGSGRVEAHPERLLGEYDIVFAKGRSALEAVASGAAVVVCDAWGLAGMLSQETYERWRNLNFGVRTLRGAISTASVLGEIDRYDPKQALALASRVRREADMQTAIDAIEKVYGEAVADHSSIRSVAQTFAASRYLRQAAPEIKQRQQAGFKLGLAQAEINTLRLRADSAESDAAAARRQSQASHARDNEREAELTQLRTDVLGERSRAERAQAQFEAAKASLAAARVANADRALDLSAHTAELERQRAQIDSAAAELDRQREQIDRAGAELAATQAEWHAAQSKFEEAEALSRQRLRELEHEQAHREQVEAALFAANAELETLRSTRTGREHEAAMRLAELENQRVRAEETAALLATAQADLDAAQRAAALHETELRETRSLSAARQRVAVAARRVALEQAANLAAIERQSCARAQDADAILRSPFWHLVRRAYAGKAPFTEALAARLRLIFATHSGDGLTRSIGDASFAAHWVDYAATVPVAAYALQTGLAALTERLQIRSRLESGGGECTWLRDWRARPRRYAGIDLVPELIERNRQRFDGADCAFDVVDAVISAVPSAEAVLCNNWFEFLPLADVSATLAHIRGSGARHLIATHHDFAGANADTLTGDWRPLNLAQAPFNLAAPVERIGGEAPSGGILALWQL